jgi:hypothetical protein
MNIGIIDADLLDNGTKHPNLALMKISGYMKANGNEVNLLLDYNDLDAYDKVYMSKVFNFTKVPIKINDHKNLKIGGTGFFEDGGESLPYEIEHHMPDYSLYNEYINDMIENHGYKESYFKDYRNYSIGFATRGCFRKCDFCVNKKYNKVHRHSPIIEFLDNSKPYIYLWDDNFLGFKDWELVLDELQDIGKPFQFRQGLDLRLVTDKKAAKLTNSKYHGDFIFAFDHIEDKNVIINKLKLWYQYTRKIAKLYVLCGFDSIDEKDIENTFERIKILMQHRSLPYIMRYENYKNSKHRGMYINLARWCNQPSFFKKKSFREFCYAQQNSESDKICSSIRYLKEFENDHPEIAKEYFDIKWSDFNS